MSEINNLSNKTLDWFELLGYSLTNSSKEFTTESKYNINRYAKILDNVGVNNYTISISGNNFTIKTKKELNEILEENNQKEYYKIFNNEGYIDLQLDEDAKKAIIRGTFLGSGTISEPKKAYHLEIYFKDEKV